MAELLEYLLAYGAVPLTAGHLYVRLHQQIDEKGVREPPGPELFLIFTVYGGWLMVFLVALARAWSNFLYLVLFYLLLVAPILMLCVAVVLIPRRQYSRYHMRALMASGGYVCLFGLAIIFLIMMLVSSG